MVLHAPASRVRGRPSRAKGIAENALPKLSAGVFEGVPVLGTAANPDRWLLWLGVLFVLSVCHFPTGIVGRLRARVKTVKTDQARG